MKEKYCSFYKQQFMEVLQTHIIQTKVVRETINIDKIKNDSEYCILFECEKNHWFVRIGNDIIPITPEHAIHLRCSA